MPSLTDLPIALALGLFALAAVAVWMGGSRLAVYISDLAERFGFSQGFAGMLFLGGITSLPEIATAGSAAVTGSADLAVSNLIGAASANIVLLVVADAMIARTGIDSVVKSASTLLQGVLGMVLMTGVAVIALLGDREIGGSAIGFGTAGLFAACALAMWRAGRYENHPGWTVAPTDRRRAGEPQEEAPNPTRTPVLIGKTVAAAAVILVAGFVLSQTADSIAQATGVSAGLVGLVLVGFATSLPELSSIVSAVRIKRFDLAVGDIFGTNIFNIAILFIVDIAYRDGLALAGEGMFEGIAALLGVGVIGVFMLGLLERRSRTVLRLGYASWSTLAAYGAGLTVLWFIQPSSGG